ncbi:MAG: GHKL domain-containing protein [Melioribacteraceae bacterium]|nr:GHKL domain-containing protein [Melioribacteraceae bacterium]
MYTGIVSTIGQKCKRCYSCIRECPANAIRVIDGQAVVIEERCISCGHCLKVCSQHAKSVESDNIKVFDELIPQFDTFAIVAPSFAASFPENYDKIPAALKKLGFKRVSETAFGADLINVKYKDIIANNKKTMISTPCPAVYNYIEKYFVELVPNLVQIVSPMIAMGRYLKANYSNPKIVFIGPCIAKKSEYRDLEVNDAIDAVLTFSEIKEIFNSNNIELDNLDTIEFDPPHAAMGKSYAISGGLLKTAGIESNILEKDLIIVEGKSKVKEIIDDIADGKIKSKFIDILFCEGCINGPAIDSDLNHYARREKVIEFIEKNQSHTDRNVWNSEIYNSRELDLNRIFTPENRRRPMPSEEQIAEILRRTNKYSEIDELNCGACGYDTCREYAIAFGKGLAEDEMCLPHLIDKLESAYTELKNTQEQLTNAEKLASIGQLAAGVAHELNNPLGTIILYSSLIRNELQKIEKDCGDVDMILDEAKRCRGIVSNLLNFARERKLNPAEVSIKNVLSEVIKIVTDTNGNDLLIELEDNAEDIIIKADKDQLKQVFINIINNAIEAMESRDEKKLRIILNNDDSKIFIKIIDCGCGIEEENINKLFTPFFTTKKIGRGTGLGLAISYGIIKMHKGDITIESELNKGTTVNIVLPVSNKYDLKLK